MTRIFSGLAVTYPDTARHAYDIGVALEKLGDTAGSDRWLDRADSLAGAPPGRGRGFLSRRAR